VQGSGGFAMQISKPVSSFCLTFALLLALAFSSFAGAREAAAGVMKENIRLMKFREGSMKQNVIVPGWLGPNEVWNRFNGSYLSPEVADALGKAYKKSVDGGY